MVSALILIADGTEEMEFTITYDTLVRAGASCTSAFVSTEERQGDSGSYEKNPPFAKGSRGINILPDTYFSPQAHTPDKFDLLVIPGGAKGAETISNSSPVQHLVRQFLEAGKYVGMICAGSLAALTAKLPKQPLTSHPSVKDRLADAFVYSEQSVVVSGKLVTSRGPGTTFPFAFTLVEMLFGKEKREEVIGPMVFPPGTWA
ncbi:DJ-1 [Dichomitus squalens]|uniref:DJ-1 n=1 Tax=Dichomitus squalens (strain LYAD-421) TaxID=732165 RepID=UPI0004413E0B|nr:DJ-1 [Dichomitus squalens LYAD-421 SS1]EJF63865.1 DJ-1 [Dichomitus squalens LYAD-421 SS1]TBU47070.1 DJ-1 [Dichomitus squalens]